MTSVSNIKVSLSQMSRIMRKLDFCLGENKDAINCAVTAQLISAFVLRYTDSTIPLLLKSEISSFYPSSVTVQAGLCRTLLETGKTVFVCDAAQILFGINQYYELMCLAQGLNQVPMGFEPRST